VCVFLAKSLFIKSHPTLHFLLRYAFEASIQILLLFGILANRHKAVAHSAHAICEVARARLGKTTHLTFLFFGFCLSIIVTSMLLLGGAVTVEDLTGMNYAALPERDQEVLRDAIMNATVRTGRMKIKSEIATMMAQGLMDQGAGTTRTPRKRQVSNADIITKFLHSPQLGYEDLRCVCVCFFFGFILSQPRSLLCGITFSLCVLLLITQDGGGDRPPQESGRQAPRGF
jgi:hypothetical protein